MGLADDMKRMGEEMITSYKQRMHENEVLVEEVKNTLEGFRKDHQEMSNNLRNQLNGGESKRHEEFSEMMTGIRNTMRNISDGVENIRSSSQSLLKMFNEEHFAMGEALRENFKANESARFEEFNEMMNGINATIEGVSKEVEDIRVSSQSVIKDFNVSRSNMSESLRNQLHKGNENLGNENLIRLKKYKETIDNIQNRVNTINSFTANLLGGFRNENIQMADSWRNLFQAKAKMKMNVGMPKKQEPEMPPKQKPEMVDKKKPKLKKENKPEIEHKETVTNEIKMQEKQVSVEEKVLDFINAHPEGVKISEMEEPIGEQRMRLGYVAKRLLVEDKVRKQDNVYYPFDENNN